MIDLIQVTKQRMAGFFVPRVYKPCSHLAELFRLFQQRRAVVYNSIAFLKEYGLVVLQMHLVIYKFMGIEPV